MTAELRTIHADDWREMFRRARAQGAEEGNAVLAQIRAKVREQFPNNYQQATQAFRDLRRVEERASPAAKLSTYE